MSYVRFGTDGSDVYMFGTEWQGRRSIECCGCSLAFDSNTEWDAWDAANPGASYFDPARPSLYRYNGKPYSFEDYQGVLDHIAEHRAAGHHVPEFVDEEIREEMALPDYHDDHWLPNVLGGAA